MCWTSILAVFSRGSTKVDWFGTGSLPRSHITYYNVVRCKPSLFPSNTLSPYNPLSLSSAVRGFILIKAVAALLKVSRERSRVLVGVCWNWVTSLDPARARQTKHTFTQYILLYFFVRSTYQNCTPFVNIHSAALMALHFECLHLATTGLVNQSCNSLEWICSACGVESIHNTVWKT